MKHLMEENKTKQKPFPTQVSTLSTVTVYKGLTQECKTKIKTPTPVSQKQ